MSDLPSRPPRPMPPDSTARHEQPLQADQRAAILQPDDTLFRSFLREMSENGPMEVGFGVTADAMTKPSLFLPKVSDLNSQITAMISNLPFRTGAARQYNQFMIWAAMFLNSKPARIDTRYARPVSNVNTQALENAIEIFNSTAREHQDDSTFASNCLLLLYSTKINWWQMNHHTGTSYEKAAGFCQRAMNQFNTSLGITGTSGADVHTVWICGHWMDTKGFLGSMGISGVPRSDENHQLFAPADRSIRLRLNSNPAGTAAFADCLAIYKAIKGTLLETLLQEDQIAEIKHALECEREMCENAALYHVGAKFLTGKDPLTVPRLSESVENVLVSILQIAMPNSTLRKSNALARLSGGRVSDARVRAALNAISMSDSIPLYKRLTHNDKSVSPEHAKQIIQFMRANRFSSAPSTVVELDETTPQQ
uniref:Nucleocapsid protein n=1 Tax=Obscuromonas Qin-like virus TaxID=3157911 RepID=A0AAU7BNV5_9VIRU